MAKKIVNYIVGLFGSLVTIPFMKELIVFLISMCPVLELRGGLIAAALFNMNPAMSYIICVIGNIVPIPFILWLTAKVIEKMRNSRSKKLNKFAGLLDKKVEKNKGKIEKYGYWGLMLFIAIPLPGTGAWTGCMVASVLEMNKKKSFLAAVAGVVIASIIMMIISFGLVSKLV